MSVYSISIDGWQPTGRIRLKEVEWDWGAPAALRLETPTSSSHVVLQQEWTKNINEPVGMEWREPEWVTEWREIDVKE